MKKVMVAMALGLLSISALAAEVKVESKNLDALNGSKKLVLANFVVEFQKEYHSTSIFSGIMGLGGISRSDAINTVELPRTEILQAITEFAHADVVRKLKAKGYTVIEPSALGAGKGAYQKYLGTSDQEVKAGGEIENVDGKSLLYCPNGYQPVVPGLGGTHYNVHNFMGREIHNTLGAFRSGPQEAYLGDLSEKEGAPILKVWITVGFGDTEASHGNAIMDRQERMFATNQLKTHFTNTASASAVPSMYLKAGVTRFSITTAGGNGFNTESMKLFGPVLPTDGKVQIRLAQRLKDDAADIPGLTSHASDITLTESRVMDNLIRSEVSTGSQSAQVSAGENGVSVQKLSSTTTGQIAKNFSDGVTALKTQTNFATLIPSPIYTTSTIKMIQDAIAALTNPL